MRVAGDFHPEWGHLAPAPSFMRRVRTVAVATAIGATAGAAVVLSLVGRDTASPAGDAGKTLVVVHSLVQPAEAATPLTPASQHAPASAASAAAPIVATQVTAPSAAPVVVAPVAPVQASAAGNVPVTLRTAGETVAQPAPPAASASNTAAATAAPAGIGAMAEAPPASESAVPSRVDDPIAVSDDNATEKKLGKKHRAAEGGPHREQSYAKRKASGGLAPLLRHLFSARAGNSYYPN